jgi:hypothetical protein
MKRTRQSDKSTDDESVKVSLQYPPQIDEELKNIILEKNSISSSHRLAFNISRL